MAQTTSNSILGMIRQESWILDHFEILRGHKETAAKPKMVTPFGE